MDSETPVQICIARLAYRRIQALAQHRGFAWSMYSLRSIREEKERHQVTQTRRRRSGHQGLFRLARSQQHLGL